MPSNQSKSSSKSSTSSRSVNTLPPRRDSTARSPGESGATAQTSGGNAGHVTVNPANPDPSADPVQPTGMDFMSEMRSMFADLSSQMNSRFDAIGNDVNIIKKDLSETKRAVVELEKAVNFNAEKIKSIEKESLPKLTEDLERKNQELERKLVLLEMHQRKQNLLVYGVHENRNENIFKTVTEIMSFFFKIPPVDAAKIHLVNAHRLPAPQVGPGKEAAIRPIIIRFTKMVDRDRLLNAFEESRRQRPAPNAGGLPQPADQPEIPLQQTPDDPAQALAQKFERVTVRTDLPPEMKRERGRLAAEAYKLRKEKNLSTRIRINGTNLYLQTRNSPQGIWTTYEDK